jgi:hypothetical protein
MLGPARVRGEVPQGQALPGQLQAPPVPAGLCEPRPVVPAAARSPGSAVLGAVAVVVRMVVKLGCARSLVDHACVRRPGGGGCVVSSCAHVATEITCRVVPDRAERLRNLWRAGFLHRVALHGFPWETAWAVPLRAAIAANPITTATQPGSTQPCMFVMSLPGLVAWSSGADGLNASCLSSSRVDGPHRLMGWCTRSPSGMPVVATTDRRLPAF